MGSFEEGLEQIRGARERRALEPAVDVARVLSREQLAGAAFQPGDQVRDLVTGQGGHVAAVGFAQDSRPAAGR